MKYTKATTDIYLAAAFWSSGAILDKVDYSDPEHIKFSFSSEESLDIIERDFDNGELVGSLSRYADSLRKIKNKLFTIER